MKHQTRYFVLGASGLLLVGLFTGLFAYVNRGAALAVSVSGPAELAFVPADASIVAYANVQEVMRSDFLPVEMCVAAGRKPSSDIKKPIPHPRPWVTLRLWTSRLCRCLRSGLKFTVVIYSNEVEIIRMPRVFLPCCFRIPRMGGKFSTTTPRLLNKHKQFVHIK